VERSALPKGANPAAASFPGLEQGHYSLTVYDGAGNPSSGTFAVDLSSPLVTLRSAPKMGLIVENASGDMTESDWFSTMDEDVSLGASDALAGIRSWEVQPVTMFDEPSGVPSGEVFDSTRAALSVSLGPLKDGTYRVKVEDGAGNATILVLIVDKTPTRILATRSDGREVLDTELKVNSARVLAGTVTVFAQDLISGISAWTITKQGAGVVFGETFTEKMLGSGFAFQLNPGVYDIRVSPNKGDPITASLEVGGFSLQVATEGSTARWDAGLGAFRADVEIEAQSDLGLESITLYEVVLPTGPPTLLASAPLGNALLPSRHAFPGLQKGYYMALGRASNGETFKSAIFFLSSAVWQASASLGDAGAQFTNVTPQGLLAGSVHFAESGFWESAPARPEQRIGRTFLGGLFRPKSSFDFGTGKVTNGPDYCQSNMIEYVSPCGDGT
ncbi:MAG: hypothetical protein AAB289_09840, partial [Chloroflexota bacterium]